jgi:hypothetical protein
MEWILDFLIAIKNMFISLVLSIFEVIKDVFFFIFETVSLLASTVLNTLFTGLDFLNPIQYIDSLPVEIIKVFEVIGFGQCFSIILSALLVKILLQTIPMVRWGSK